MGKKNILWLKCTSHGRGWFCGLEKYIIKNGHNLIGNINDEVPHNTTDFMIDGDNLYYNNIPISFESIDIAVFIFCPESSVLTDDCKKYLFDIEKLLKKYNNIKIINYPSQIIELNSKINFYNILKSSGIDNLPNFKKIHNEQDINNIDFYPVILRQDNLFGGDGMIYCDNKESLLKSYKKLTHAENVFAVQYLESRFKNYRNVLLRICVINNKIVQYYAVEGSGWNVHTSTGFNNESFFKINIDIDEYIDVSLLERLCSALYRGTYGFDCIINNNKLYFVEANNKIGLARYQIPKFNGLCNGKIKRFEDFNNDERRNKILMDALINE